MITKYLDPKNDLAFKKIFGEERHKGICMSFLNAALCLEGSLKIVDLEFLNTNNLPEVAARKESVVDVLVRDQQGYKYVVEMQVAKVEGFEKRAQFYAAKTYCSHFKQGEGYTELKKVIFLALTDYVIFPEKEGYKSDHVILDNKTYENDLQDFSFTFVELPKFTKSLSELKTLEDKWYYFLKHASENNAIDEVLASSPEISQAYDVLERFNWSEEELIWYDQVALNKQDYENGLIAARKEGHEEGREEEKREMAKRMLTMGLLSDAIAKVTDLAVEEVDELRSH